jgi:hypothetical protein
VVFERTAEATLNIISFERVAEFGADNAEDFLHQLAGLAGAEHSGTAAAELLREGSFQQPGSGPPVGLGRLLHQAEWAEPGKCFGLAKLLVEIGIPLGLATNRVERAADIPGCFAKSAAPRDERADFAALASSRACGRPTRWRLVRDRRASWDVSNGMGDESAVESGRMVVLIRLEVLGQA